MIEVHLSAVQKGLQQQLRTRVRWTHSDACFFLHNVTDIGEAKRISWRNNNPLFAARKADQNGIMKVRPRPERFYIRVDFIVVYCMQVDRGRNELAPDEAIQSCVAALWERGEAGSTFAQCPLQQYVVASADDRHWFRGCHAVGAHHAVGEPAVEFVLWKQPAAGDLGAGDRAGGDQLIELALLDPKVARGFYCC